MAQEQVSPGGWRLNAVTDLHNRPWVAINYSRSSCLSPNPRSPAPEHNCTAGVFERRSLLFNIIGLQQIDSVTAPSVRDLNPPRIDMTYRNGFFGYLSSYCVLRKL